MEAYELEKITTKTIFANCKAFLTELDVPRRSVMSVHVEKENASNGYNQNVRPIFIIHKTLRFD